MNKKRIYKKIAKKYGTTPDQVEREIQKALSLAWADPNKSNTVKKVQNEISQGSTPSTEEVLEFAKRRLRGDS